ncbi:MAG: hypoxanthine phosphoribosyltransferase [Aquificae bacterium]|nr:hypoxanthine phosphoribosyltransferase [Aquificota bacterium]
MLEIRGKKLRLVIDEERIKRRVKELALELERELGGGEPPVFIGLLKGSFIFLADLIRELSLPAVVDFMRVSSYGSGTESSGEVRILKEPELELKGKKVVLVDDILDTGLTLKRVKEYLLEKEPAVLKTCVLLDKKEARKVPFEADLVGFEVPNDFLVGYGLDWGELGRNLRGIYAVEL